MKERSEELATLSVVKVYFLSDGELCLLVILCDRHAEFFGMEDNRYVRWSLPAIAGEVCAQCRLGY